MERSVVLAVGISVPGISAWWDPVWPMVVSILVGMLLRLRVEVLRGVTRLRERVDRVVRW